MYSDPDTQEQAPISVDLLPRQVLTYQVSSYAMMSLSYFCWLQMWRLQCSPSPSCVMVWRGNGVWHTGQDRPYPQELWSLHSGVLIWISECPGFFTKLMWETFPGQLFIPCQRRWLHIAAVGGCINLAPYSIHSPRPINSSPKFFSACENWKARN